jgi:hypothetical protein
MLSSIRTTRGGLGIALHAHLWCFRCNTPVVSVNGERCCAWVLLSA